MPDAADAEARQHDGGGGVGAAAPGRFLALLWEDLFVRLLLDVAPRPAPDEIAWRAKDATEALLRLYG